MQLPHHLRCGYLYSHNLQSTSHINTSLCTTHHSSSGIQAVSSVASTDSMQLSHLLQCSCLYSHNHIHNHIHTSHIIMHHSLLKSSCVSCVKCGNHWLNEVAPSSPILFPVLTQSQSQSQSTIHITQSHNHTSNAPLTTQIKLCKLCHVWQALTQYSCPICSNAVAYTHNHNHTMWHHTSRTSSRTSKCTTHDSSQAV